MSPARRASKATVDPSDDTTSTGLPVARAIVVDRIRPRMYCSVNVFAPTTMRAGPGGSRRSRTRTAAMRVEQAQNSQDRHQRRTACARARPHQAPAPTRRATAPAAPPPHIRRERPPGSAFEGRRRCSCRDSAHRQASTASPCRRSRPSTSEAPPGSRAAPAATRLATAAVATSCRRRAPLLSAQDRARRVPVTVFRSTGSTL